MLEFLGNMSSRTGARLAAFIVALMLSKSQDRFFDCNKLPFLSYVFGVATLLVIYGAAERVYEVMSSDEPDRQRAVVTAVVGCIAAAGAAFVTMMTHICH